MQVQMGEKHVHQKHLVRGLFAGRTECSRRQALGRTICNEQMVFFKGPDGKVAAVEDFCPHRGAPLSLGKVCNGKLVCGYHGLEMGCEGKTVHMPGQRVRGFPAVKAFAVALRYGFVWVWPGDQAKADVAKMPVFEFLENPAWAYGGGLYHVKADYRLMIDNLMDLTHETYVHATSIGQPEIDETPCTTTVEGDKVILQRHMEGIQAPPFWQMAMSANGLDPQAKVDRWQICRFSPPSHIMIDVGVALAGQGGFDAAPEHKPTAWWSTSSRPTPRPRIGTTGAWRASSSLTTRNSQPRSVKVRARSSMRTWTCCNCSKPTSANGQSANC